MELDFDEGNRSFDKKKGAIMAPFDFQNLDLQFLIQSLQTFPLYISSREREASLPQTPQLK